jgi:hypothetical protein
MHFLKESIQRKLDELPEPALQEVLDFVEFLLWKMVPREEPVLVVAGILSGSPLSAEEIERELYGDTEGTP